MRIHASSGAALRKAFACVALSLAAIGAAQTQAERYSRRLRDAVDWGERKAVLEEMRDSKDASLAAAFGAVLDQALGVERSRLDALEREQYDASLAIVCAALGAARRLESREGLFRLASSSAAPVVRSEALIALGRMRAREYASQIAEILARANEGISGSAGAGSGVGAGGRSGPTDRDAAETVAYGCVVSLGAMGGIVGWREVLVASQGRYGPLVRKAAEQSLASMAADPTEAVIVSIDAEAPAIGESALRYEMASSASPAAKTRAAIAAISAGRAKDAGTFQERAAARALRISGVNALSAIGGNDPAPAPLLRESWRKGDGDERIAVIKALGSNQSAACVDELYSIIEELDQARRIGNAREDSERLMRAALASAGRSKNRRLEPVVRTVLANAAWTGAVKAAANEALASMGAR